MKKLVSLLLVSLFILSLVGCGATTDKPEETAVPTETVTYMPTAEPTETPTEAPTEAPTEVPTEVPTDAPTPEPTEAPKMGKLAFSECAVEVARLPWYTGRSQDVDDSGVYWENPDESEGMWPEYICVDGDLIYVYDEWAYHHSMLVYNMKTGEKTRIYDLKVSHLTSFAVLNGKIYSATYVCDIGTGEFEKIDPVFPGFDAIMESTYIITVRDGKIYMYASEPDQPKHDFEGPDWLNEYELNEELHLWMPIRRVVEKISDTEMVLEDGTKIGFGFWIGDDNEGCHYVFHTEGYGTLNRVIEKYAPDGTPLSSTELVWDHDIEFPGPLAEASCMRLGTDGKLYMFVSYKEAFVVYRIDM